METGRPNISGRLRSALKQDSTIIKTEKAWRFGKRRYIIRKVRAAGGQRDQNRTVWQLLYRQMVALGLENDLLKSKGLRYEKHSNKRFSDRTFNIDKDIFLLEKHGNDVSQ